MVKSILNKWVQYNTEIQIINNSFVKLTGSAGILLMDVHTRESTWPRLLASQISTWNMYYKF